MHWLGRARQRRFWHLGFVTSIGVSVLTGQSWVVAGNAESLSPNAIELPTFPVSGVAATIQLPPDFLQPPSSLLTARSSLLEPRDDSAVDVPRSSSAVSSHSTFSALVTAAAAAEGGTTPLVEVVDPSTPYEVYRTVDGDSLSLIAARFGIEIAVLLDNNPTVSDGGILPSGFDLIVPRDSGILHKVNEGETVETIVGQYDTIASATVFAYRPNRLSADTPLVAGNFVLLPGATRKPPPPPVTAADPGAPDPGTHPPPSSAGRFSLPLGGWSGISDPFGIYRGAGRIHEGIDLTLWGYYHTPVYAACEGVVSTVEWRTYSYGYHVIVDCGDGWTTLYAHMSDIVVTRGQRVTAGTQVGVTGSTGFSTGEHLHFEIRLNGAPLNPADFLPF